MGKKLLKMVPFPIWLIILGLLAFSGFGLALCIALVIITRSEKASANLCRIIREWRSVKQSELALSDEEDQELDISEDVHLRGYKAQSSRTPKE